MYICLKLCLGPCTYWTRNAVLQGVFKSAFTRLIPVPISYRHFYKTSVSKMKFIFGSKSVNIYSIIFMSV